MGFPPFPSVFSKIHSAIAPHPSGDTSPVKLAGHKQGELGRSWSEAAQWELASPEEAGMSEGTGSPLHVHIPEGSHWDAV